MLRLKQALSDCGIPNQALVKISGCSKALVSRTLATGVFPPQDAEKFKAGVARMVGDDARLIDWMNDRHMHIDDLYAKVRAPEQSQTLSLPSPDTLPRLLCDIAGRAVLNDSGDFANEMIIQLARTASFLHRKMAEMAGHDAPWTMRTEAEAAAILKGVQS
jgi:hypothetical protein